MRKRTYIVLVLLMLVELPLVVAAINSKNDKPITKETTINGVSATKSQIDLIAIYATPTATSTPTATATVAGGPQLVQQKTGTATSDTITVTFDTAIGLGHFLVAYVGTLNTSTIVSTNTAPGAEVDFQVESARNVAGVRASILSSNANDTSAITDTGITVVQTSAITPIVVVIQEWSGVNAMANEDATGSTDVANATVTTGTVTPGSTNNVIMAIGGWTANDYSSGPTNGFTRGAHAGTGAIWIETAYLSQSAADPADTGWTLTAGINWAAAIAAFGAP